MSGQAQTYVMTLDIDDSTSYLLLLVLAFHTSNDDGSTFVSQKRLSFETKMSVRTVQRHLAALEASGIISRTERRKPDGSASTDTIKLAGFIDWLEHIEARTRKPVNQPHDNLAGGLNDQRTVLSGGTCQQVSPGKTLDFLKQELNLDAREGACVAGATPSRASASTATIPPGSSDVQKEVRQREVVVRCGDLGWSHWQDHLRQTRQHELLEAIEAARGLVADDRWPRTATGKPRPMDPQPMPKPSAFREARYRLPGEPDGGL